MVRATAMTDQEFEQLALDDPSAHWELWCGRPRRKPAMTTRHNDVAEDLNGMLWVQLDRKRYRVRTNAGHVYRPEQSYFIPDVFVVPRDSLEPAREQEDRLEAYSVPLPLVVEVWSRSTGRYDQRTKLEEYRRRGDREIWFIHPYNRTLTAWRIQPDGSYTEQVIRGGKLRPIALPGVEIDLDSLLGL